MESESRIFSGSILLILMLFLFAFDSNGQEQNKKFELYDAMNYIDKPDLTNEGLLPLLLIYEAHLTKKDPNDPYGIVLDTDKIQMHVDVAKYTNQKVICTDIEHWYGDRNVDSEELEKRFTELFNIFKEQLPDIQISNYGVAPSALCVMRFYDNGKSKPEALLERWRRGNKKRWDVAKTVDYFSPSVYIAEPNIKSWIEDLKTTVDEVRKFDPTKKLIVYIWPNYYDKPGSPYFKEYVAPEIWEQMLEAVYTYCDGAIIWSSTYDKDNKRTHWSDPNVQAFMDVTRKFVKKHSASMAKPFKQNKLPPLNAIGGKSFNVLVSDEYSEKIDFDSYGVKLVKIVSESDLSINKTDNGIWLPDSLKISKLAQTIKLSHPGLPLCVLTSTWISDRVKDNKAMLDRFDFVYRIFKSNNTENAICFSNVGPASLNVVRNTNPDYRRNVSSWMTFNVTPTKILEKYVDIILPAGTIINDQVEDWERDFRITVAESKKNDPKRVVYTLLDPQYANSSANLINSETWYRMLEVVYDVCDGAIIARQASKGNQTILWDENSNFWRATDAFLKKYRIQMIE